jgi:hypothetical protein
MKWWENPEVTFNGVNMDGGETHRVTHIGFDPAGDDYVLFTEDGDGYRYTGSEEFDNDDLLDAIQRLARSFKTSMPGVIQMIEGEDGIWRMSRSPRRAQ